MDTLAKSDIFFFITSIAVIILTILGAIALVYAIKLLRDAKAVMAEVKRQSEVIISDIDDARAYVKREGLKLGAYLGILGSFFRKRGAAKKRRVREAEEVESEE